MNDITNLNPCPLNACCDIWGQCGTTQEFCTNTSTGAPGTAKQGTNGCISNCGTNIVIGKASEYRSVAYYEGFNFQRKCQYQDIGQVNSSAFTHIHFGFAQITPDYQVTIPDQDTFYEFRSFLLTTGFKKILSFGGWDFSTNPSTYNILRQGTTPANRLTLATNIANFIKKWDLDGVDIDWEYPSAPDIPGIPPGAEDEGDNYLAFLVVLKNLIGGRSVSIAAPASYWYLKGFPIKEISKVVDYIIYMTYDLHGQWVTGNSYSQIGCPSGSRLRSDVNLTETVNALSMITKAGVPSGKVVVGVTAYGRSFAMAEAGCITPDCQFTGTRLQSNAEPGPCTNTAGCISNAEIEDILKNSSRVNNHFVDSLSNSNILVYDDMQWVAYMDSNIREFRTNAYKRFGMGGTTLWATDLEEFTDPPHGFTNWPDYSIKLQQGETPALGNGPRHGNWTKLNCGDPHATDALDFTAKQRWDALDASGAWSDLIHDWVQYCDGLGGSFGQNEFSSFISTALNFTSQIHCAQFDSNSRCRGITRCADFIGSKTGPAGELIISSFIKINLLYASFVDGLEKAAAEIIDPSLDDMQQTFAPTPPPPNDEWKTILFDLVSMGVGMVAGPFVGKVIGELPYFAAATEASKKTADLVKSSTTSFLSTALSIGSDFAKNKPSGWKPPAQAHFKNYLGHVIDAWDHVATVGLRNLFSGDDNSIQHLTQVLANGKFIDGQSGEYGGTTQSQNLTLSESISKTFYAFAIPAIWQASGYNPFIIDTGLDCSTAEKQKIKLKGACVDGKYYRLGEPKGSWDGCVSSCGDGYGYDSDCVECSDDNFSSPHGVDRLGSSDWSDVTVNDLITGSVRTWKQNKKQNGSPPADPSKPAVLEQLLHDDITTPGFVRMPVCSADHARNSWSTTSSSAKDYPCNLDNGYNFCQVSSFTDETSGASPLVSDCEEMIQELADADPPRAWYHVGIGPHHKLLTHKSCKFGVTAKGVHGSVDFKVGGQDVIDLTRDSIKKFAKNGRVGSKGKVDCHGNAGTLPIDWGLF